LESPQGRQRHRHSKDGGWLKANARSKDIILIDEKGGMFKLTIADVNQSNGVIHVVDTRPSSQLTTRGSVTLPSERHESNVLITQSRD
jgi:MinD-like ATPase involved in chromosome partitioning or flagellar assembly